MHIKKNKGCVYALGLLTFTFPFGEIRHTTFSELIIKMY